MITNYDKYLEDIKRIEAEKKILQLREDELDAEEDIAKKNLHDEFINYIKSEFNKKLIKIDEDTYNFNDNIGVYINPNQISQIKIETVYYINKKITAKGTYYFSWKYNSKTSIDEFINDVITEIQEIQEKRDKASLSKIKKKYNL